MNAPTKISWTTRELLKWMADAFEGKGLESPRVLAELLMGHVLGCERIRLNMDADRPASAEERETLRGLVGRALKHEPVQYLVGEAVFFTHTFVVDPRVLVPRPSSAVLVETVIEHAKRTGRHAVNPYDDEVGEVIDAEEHARPEHVAAPMTIADVCTGTGALAISLAKAIPSSTVIATDLSAEALEVARANAERLGVSDRVEFVEGDLLAPLAGRRFDAVVANPPYIPDHEWEAVEANVKEHEPSLALRSSPDGLRHAEPILRGVRDLLTQGGVFAVEIATSTADAALKIARDAGHARARVVKDFEGLDRAIVGEG